MTCIWKCLLIFINLQTSSGHKYNNTEYKISCGKFSNKFLVCLYTITCLLRNILYIFFIFFSVNIFVMIRLVVFFN